MSSTHVGITRTRSTLQPREARKSQFNDWDLIRRSNVDCGYKKVLRFRSAIYPAVKSRAMTLTPAKVSRRPKGTLSASLLDSGDRNSSLSGSIDHFDPDQFFKGEFDFDAEEPEEPPLYPHLVHKPGTYAQEMYLKACRLLGIKRSARCYKMLAGEAVVLPRQGLGPDDVKACAIALAETMNIHTLDFTENMIGTKGAEYIALLITENNFIKNLNLADNNLGPDAVKLIADSVKKADSLSSISLAGNGLSGTRCVAVKSLIEDSLNLKVLDLSNNDLGDVGVDIVAESLAFNDTIERLDLGNNQVTNITKLAQTLSKNTGLVQLNLSSNGLHVSGCRDLARALEKNTTLRELNLAKNRIDRACLNKLFGGLKKNAFLRVLKIDYNPLNSEDAMHVLTFITENPATGLSYIYMDSIDVQANFVQTLNTLKQAREITITYGKIIGTDLGIHDLDEALVLEATDFVVFEELSRVIGLDIENFVKDVSADLQRTISSSDVSFILTLLHVPFSDRTMDIFVNRLKINNVLDISQLDQRRQKRAKEREHERKCKIDSLQATGELTCADKKDAQERADVTSEIQRILTRRKYGSSVYNSSFEVMRRKLNHQRRDGELRLRRYVVEMVQRRHKDNVVLC